MPTANRVTKPVEEPVDLGIKIGSKKQGNYEKLLKSLTEEHEQLLMQLEINDTLKEHCEIKIAYEKQMFK